MSRANINGATPNGETSAQPTDTPFKVLLLVEDAIRGEDGLTRLSPNTPFNVRLSVESIHLSSSTPLQAKVQVRRVDQSDMRELYHWPTGGPWAWHPITVPPRPNTVVMMLEELYLHQNSEPGEYHLFCTVGDGDTHVRNNPWYFRIEDPHNATNGVSYGT
jgi:hypothetical protein